MNRLEVRENNVRSLEKDGDGPGTLPIEKYRDQILESVRNNQTTVLVGETGSGKTTMSPRFLMDAFPDKKIAVTSPRVLPARSVSSYVAMQMGETVGRGRIGLITREVKEFSGDTQCTFMTDGILLNMLRIDPMLSSLDVVMIDEAHERGINVDFSLGLLKRAQKLRKEKGLSELKIMVASATIEEEKFVNYFDSVPLVKVPGRMFPVETHYVPHVMKDNGEKMPYTEQAAVVANKILQDYKKDGDILIFMPGEAEINHVIECFNKLNNDQGVEVLPLFGSMKAEDQDKIFARNGKRKVIVATNVAETSITIDTVKHVIDSGLVKQKSYNPETGIDSLVTTEASQANMNQRMGRAGRVSDGDCYRLMGEHGFEKRDEFSRPEILRSNLGEIVLKMKDMGIDDVIGFDFIDKPSKVAVVDAINQLKALGALDEEDKITEMGKEMVRMPLRPDLSRALIEARDIGCLDQMVDICAMMSTSKSAIIQPKREGVYDSDQVEKVIRQNSLKVAGSDYMTMLNIWRKWEEDGFTTSFAFDNLLNIKVLREVGQVRDQLLKILGENSSDDNRHKEHEDLTEEEKITKCLLTSRPNNIFFEVLRRKYPTYDMAMVGTNIKDVSVFPGSVSFKTDSKFFIGEDVYTNDKGATYVRKCHNLTLDKIKKLVPHMVVREKEGEPQKSFYTGQVTQNYVIKINGVVATRDDEVIEGGGNSISSLYRRGFGSAGVSTYESERDTTVYLDAYTASYDLERTKLESGMTLREHNEYVTNRLNYYKAKNRNLAFDLPRFGFVSEKIRADIDSGLMKSKEDIMNNISRYTLNINDYISQEEIDETLEKSPDYIDIGGVSLGVRYINGTARISFDLNTVMRIVNNEKRNLEVDLPLVDSIEFVYAYEPGSSSFSNGGYGTRPFDSLKDLIHYALTNKYESEKRDKIEQSLGGQELADLEKEIDALGKGEILGLSGKIDSLQKKEVFERRVEILRGIIVAMDKILLEIEDSKDKNKVSTRLTNLKKELRLLLEKIKDYKRVEIKAEDIIVGIKSFEKVLSSEEFVNTFKMKNKRFLVIIYNNVKLLLEAAVDGDVEINEELKDKIFKKSLELTKGLVPALLNKEKADELIIEMI